MHRKSITWYVYSCHMLVLNICHKLMKNWKVFVWHAICPLPEKNWDLSCISLRPLVGFVIYRVPVWVMFKVMNKRLVALFFSMEQCLGLWCLTAYIYQINQLISIFFLYLHVRKLVCGLYSEWTHLFDKIEMFCFSPHGLSVSCDRLFEPITWQLLPLLIYIIQAHFKSH